MARKPTPKPPAATPVEFDPLEFMDQLAAMQGDLTVILGRTHRAEMLLGQVITRQADAEKRQDIRITEKLAPLSIRGITAAERVIEILESLPVQIEQAGLKASQEMAHNSLQAKRLMEGVETAAFIRMQTMRDQAITMVQEVQDDARARMRDIRDHAIKGTEKARDEAIIVLQGMGNSAANMVAQAGVSIAERLRETVDLGKRLVEESATTAQASITSTASAASAEFVKATAKASAAFDLSKACVLSFEASVADLKRIGPWLSNRIERRTWQIAGATGVSAVATAGLALMLYRGVIWAMGSSL